MIKRIVINNGRKFTVNCPGYEDGVGPIAPQGTLWMKSSDENWYAINASSSNGNLSSSINQTPIEWASPGQDYGYQLLAGNDGKSYYIYLSGSTPNVVLMVSQSAYTGSADPKPNFNLYSITDGNYYLMGLHNVSGSISLS